MRLTDEQVMQDNKRFANCNALAELKFCGWDIPHRKSITNDEIHFYAWVCRSAVAMLKEQESKWIHRADMDYKDKNGVVHFHGMCESCGFIHDFIDVHTGRYKFCPECGSKNEQWKDGDGE